MSGTQDYFSNKQSCSIQFFAQSDQISQNHRMYLVGKDQIQQILVSLLSLSKSNLHSRWCLLLVWSFAPLFWSSSNVHPSSNVLFLPSPTLPCQTWLFTPASSFFVCFLQPLSPPSPVPSIPAPCLLSPSISVPPPASHSLLTLHATTPASTQHPPPSLPSHNDSLKLLELHNTIISLCSTSPQYFTNIPGVNIEQIKSQHSQGKTNAQKGRLQLSRLEKRWLKGGGV